MTTTLGQQVIDYTATILKDVIGNADVFAVFVAGGLAFHFLALRRVAGSAGAEAERQGWLQGALAYVFPAAIYRDPTVRADRWNFVLAYVLWLPLVRAALASALAVSTVTSLYALLGHAIGFHAAPFASPVAQSVFAFACLFLGAELGAYLSHMALHRVPLLWCVHRVHHSSEALNFFARERLHPIEFVFVVAGRSVLGSAIAAAALFLAGVPPTAGALSAFVALSLVLPFLSDVWRHSHVPISLGWLDRILCSPVMHQLHHSAEERHFDTNYGAELTLFDWLFGTLYLPQPGEDYRWGLNADELGENNPHLTLRGFYLAPFTEGRAIIAAWWRARRRGGEAIAPA